MFYLVISGSIFIGCLRCLRMIFFMICEDVVYILVNLEGKEDKYRDEFGNCILSYILNSFIILELKFFLGLSI